MVVVGKKNLKEFVGVVISDKGDKTIIVEVERVKMHPLYGKRYTVSKKYYVHDEENQAHVGDTVRIREARPISKLKRRKLQEVV
jgi:small subunit ribosomal protein S17